MSTFNPDEFLTGVSPDTESFDPDSFLNDGLTQDEATIKKYKEEQAKYGSTGQQLAAGALGAARGATLGLSDLALSESGLVDPETLKGLSEANPITSGAGNIAGSAAAIIGTGGAAGLTKGLGTTAKIAGQALEGAAFGAGSAVSDYAMGDPNLNAQKIAAHIGTGALFGGGLGAIGEGIAMAVPKVTQALSNSVNKVKSMVGESTILNDVAPNWAEKFKLGLEGVEGPAIKSRELIKNLDDMVNTSKKAANELYEIAAPANIGKALESMPADVAQSNFDNMLENVRMRVNGAAEIATDEGFQLSSNKSLKIVNSLLDNLEAKAVKFKTAKDYQQGMADFVKTLDKELKAKKIIKFDMMPTATQISDQDVLRNISSTIRNDLKNPEMWGEAATHFSETSGLYSNYKTAYENFKKDFMKTQISAGGIKKSVIDPSKVQSFFNKFDDVKYDLKKQHLNDFIQETDNLARASENYSGFKKGEESISEYVKNLATKNEELAKVASIMSSSGLKSDLTRDGIAALGASAIGVPNPVIGAVLGTMKVYEGVTNPYQFGKSLSTSVAYLKAIGDIVQKTTKSIDSGAKSIFSGNTTKAISSGIASTSEKEYNKNYNKIKELSENPEALQAHLEKTTSGMSEAAPNISVGLNATITRGLEFLGAKMPRPANELPLNSKWAPTKSQMATFNRYVSAVNDPIGVLKQVKNGTVSNEAMEALMIVHPDLLQTMREAVIGDMTPKKASKLNYTTKIALSKFMGQPLESNMLPAVLKGNQDTFIMPGQQNQQPKSPKSTVGGLKELKLGSREATPITQSQMSKD